MSISNPGSYECLERFYVLTTLRISSPYYHFIHATESVVCKSPVISLWHRGTFTTLFRDLISGSHNPKGKKERGVPTNDLCVTIKVKDVLEAQKVLQFLLQNVWFENVPFRDATCLVLNIRYYFRPLFYLYFRLWDCELRALHLSCPLRTGTSRPQVLSVLL